MAIRDLAGWGSGVRVVAAAAICMATAFMSEAQQRGRQGPSPQQMQRMRQQMQRQQQEMVRWQTEMAAKQREEMAKFDDNHDGKLTGAEKAKFERHMRDVRFGRAPNPYTGIKPPGQGAGR